MKKLYVSGVAALATFGSLLVAGLAHAQTTTWSVASTTALGQTAETNGSGNAYSMIMLIIPITLGLAAFFFALRWIWHRIAGRH